jgi:hypothetical protein
MKVMLELVSTINPDAIEIHRDGRSIATIRRTSDNWSLWTTGTIVPPDMLKLVSAFITEREGGAGR